MWIPLIVGYDFKCEDAVRRGRMKSLLVISLVLFTFSESMASEELTLTITDQNGQSKTFPREAVLKNSELITFSNDPAYPGRIPRRAVELKKLLEISLIRPDPDAILVMKATDGFAKPFYMRRLNNGSSTPFVAVEKPGEPWGKMVGENVSGGPFSLVWGNPKAAKIVPEEYPNRLASIEVKGRLKDVFPGLMPAENLKKNNPVAKGLGHFLTHCSACHRLNNCGFSENLGPDLNSSTMTGVPLSIWIRDPSGERKKTGDKMPGFDKNILTEIELKELVSYIEHMKSRKKENCNQDQGNPSTNGARTKS
jgi:mono/diheme cytochrome c family protein